MRLIDTDALMHAMYHRAFETDGATMWQSGCWVRYKAIEQVVKEQPSVDAEPVVRCKDCKHYQFADNRAFGMPVKMCKWFGFEDVDDDDYCSRGERKDG